MILRSTEPKCIMGVPPTLQPARETTQKILQLEIEGTRFQGLFQIDRVDTFCLIIRRIIALERNPVINFTCLQFNAPIPR